MAFDFSTRDNDRVTFNRAIRDLSGRHARIYKAQTTHQDWALCDGEVLGFAAIGKFCIRSSFTILYVHVQTFIREENFLPLGEDLIPLVSVNSVISGASTFILRNSMTGSLRLEPLQWKLDTCGEVFIEWVERIANFVLGVFFDAISIKAREQMKIPTVDLLG